MEGAGIVMAVLLTLAGDVVTIAEMQPFDNRDDCYAFARMEAPVVTRIGALGIGCAEFKGKTITMKFFGAIPQSSPRRMKKK